MTDAATFARIMHEGPTNLVESWFPTRIVTDLVALASGARRGTLAPAIHIHPTRRKPRLVILGGDGVIRKAHIRPLDPHVVLPGYEHLDVLTAAEQQNNGRPEGSCQTLVDLIERATAAR